MITDRFEAAVSEFVRTEFGNKHLSINNQEDILWAVEKAYQDMMPRTIKGHEIKVKEHCTKKLREKLLAILKQRSPTSREDFKKKHIELCRDFLNELNAELEKRSLALQKYGKAQKAVNMTFKYLYCFDGKDKYAGWFEYAHMPLDSLLLNWYESNPDRKVKTQKAWSNLDDSEYYDIAEDIFGLLDRDPLYHNTIKLPKQPLLADFIIWAEEKNRIRVSELKAMLKKAAADEAFCQWIDPNDAKEIKEAAYQIASCRGDK